MNPPAKPPLSKPVTTELTIETCPSHGHIAMSAPTKPPAKAKTMTTVFGPHSCDAIMLL